MKAISELHQTKESGAKGIVAQSEGMLNRQRRVKRQVRKDIANGVRNARERFGIDSDTCTGDHSCIRLSGCPSLSIKSNPDPLRQDPVATVLNSCVGCGLCGEVSHAAVLCPSFYRARIITHPKKLEVMWQRIQNKIIHWLQDIYERQISRVEG